MNTKETTELAIKRHDIDAAHFQSTYSKQDQKELNKRESVF